MGTPRRTLRRRQGGALEPAISPTHSGVFLPYPSDALQAPLLRSKWLGDTYPSPDQMNRSTGVLESLVHCHIAAVCWSHDVPQAVGGVVTAAVRAWPLYVSTE